VSGFPAAVAKGRTHASYGWPRTATLGLRGAGLSRRICSDLCTSAAALRYLTSVRMEFTRRT
jgi:hypothetical protein